MKNIILSVQNVTKIYHDNDHEVRALDNVSLSFYEGEILGLLGVNGAGKTTLSSLLATLHPPTSGDIVYKGTSIYKNLMSYRKSLGFCPQTQNLDQFLNVEENLIFAGRYFLVPKHEIHARAHELMEQLELTKYARFNVNALSGGNKQRLLIARSLMHKPSILILDEPTVGLDPDIRQKLWQHIRDLKKQGITVILTTHYLDEAEILSDRICVMHKGTIKLLETMEELKKKHLQVSLETIFLKLMKEYEEKP
ncbi:MAG: ABC transporter ATP-binding protein [bacterium]|nr:ABC transporter ATP-binding protein [bacterium]